MPTLRHRAVLTFYDEADRLSVFKSNLTPRPTDLLFELEPVDHTVHIRWKGPAAPLPSPMEVPTVFDQACDFLRHELRAGPRLAAELQQRATEAGIGIRTFKNARVHLRVKPIRRDGKWWCELEENRG